MSRGHGTGSRNQILEATLEAGTVALCRLRYVGSAHDWQVAIHRASHDDYQNSIFPGGLPIGTCPDALDLARGLYLVDPTGWQDSLRGHFHPFVDVACDPPEPVPEIEGDRQQWATLNLGSVAAHEQWQSGRYSYTTERRDDGGRAVEVFAHGVWDRTG